MLAILAEAALRSFMLGSVVWLGLRLLRVRNPHVHMTSWIMVLVASLAMPLLMHWTTVSIMVDALPAATAEPLWPASNSLTAQSLEPPRPALPSNSGMPVAAAGASHASVN